jgi:hypothetical protein
MTGDRSHSSSAQVRSIALVYALEHTQSFMLYFCILVIKLTLFPYFSSIGVLRVFISLFY